MKCDKCQSEVIIGDTQQIKTEDGVKNVCRDCIEDFMSCDMFGIAGDFNKDMRGIEFGVRNQFITANKIVIPGFIITKLNMEPQQRRYDLNYRHLEDIYGTSIRPVASRCIVKAELDIDADIVKIPRGYDDPASGRYHYRGFPSIV